MIDTKYVNQILVTLNEKYPNALGLKEYFRTLLSSNDTNQHDIRRKVIDILVNEGLAEENKGNPGDYKITQKGQHVVKNGGYELYLNNKENAKWREAEIEELTFEKLKYDVRNAKRIFKTYWWTFWFALVGLLISLALLLLKIIESTKY